MMDNQNINQFTPNNIKKPKKDQQKLNLATLNVKGLNSTYKQEQLINYMNLYNIDILGLSETNIPIKQSSYTCRSKSHTSYFHNSNSSLGSGVGIILSNDIAKYVKSTNSFKGRVIYVDLYMKGHTKLRIIQVYLHASPTYRPTETQALYKEIENLILNSTKDNFKLIIIGDF